MTTETRTGQSIHAASRIAFWLALIAFGVLGFIGGMGRGPGLLLGAVVLAAYDLTRHHRTSTLGYGLLIVGMGAVAALWLWAGR